MVPRDPLRLHFIQPPARRLGALRRVVTSYTRPHENFIRLQRSGEDEVLESLAFHRLHRDKVPARMLVHVVVRAPETLCRFVSYCWSA